MPQDRLELMLEMQLELQQKSMKDGDPRNLVGDEMADFMRWNAFALEDEIHEAMQEIGWKPWASSRFVKRNDFLKEMVDAFHFFMNMLLVVCGPEASPREIADVFTAMYIQKNIENARRQREGYDGVSSKCHVCKRELVGEPLQCPVHGVYRGNWTDQVG